MRKSCNRHTNTTPNPASLGLTPIPVRPDPALFNLIHSPSLSLSQAVDKYLGQAEGERAINQRKKRGKGRTKEAGDHEELAYPPPPSFKVVPSPPAKGEGKGGGGAAGKGRKYICRQMLKD